MLEASYLRETAEHLRSRAETAALPPMRAQLLELADYYEGMAEDIEAPAWARREPAPAVRAG